MNDGASDATDPSSFRPSGRECPVCARFEVAWKFADSRAPRPRIQEYVNAVPEPERTGVLSTLLALELKYRRGKGEQPTPDEYFATFPAAAAVIYSVFDRMGIWSNGDTSRVLPAQPSSEEVESRDSDGNATDNRASADDLRTPSAPVEELKSGATETEETDSQHTMDYSPGLEDRTANPTDRAPNRETQVADEFGTMDYRPAAEGPAAEGLAAEGGSEGTDGEAGDNGTRRVGTADTERLINRDRQRRHGPECLPKVPGYEILGRLGKGGMGIVYKARHLKLQRLVALKMIIPDHDHAPTQTELERFLAEARVVAQFHHPNLVQIYEIGEHEGRPYFSLELVEGGNLHKKLAGTPQPPAEATAQLEILARAMEYAHQKDIVHRDIKPSNILLTADGTPKVTDFGLAKQMDQSGSEADDGGIVGTPSYMAPEQALGKNSEVGRPADIYALGALFYEMLTGRPPFKAAKKWQTIKLVRTAEPVPPRQLVPQVPRDLELICLRCLDKVPARRFPSAQALADELRRYQEGRPILTRPAPVWEKAWKWCRRQPVAASLVAVSAVALVSVFLFLYQQVREAQRDLKEAQQISDNRVKVKTFQIEAEEALKRDDLDDALGKLKAAIAIIHTAPHVLGDLEPPLDLLRAELARRKDERQGALDADKDYKEFNRLRDLALLHGMVFEGVDLAANMALTKQECEGALHIFGVRADAGTTPLFSNHLSAQRKNECRRACYELLLIWAEATKHEPGPQASLGLLDRADRLGLAPTGAYHLRRAGYLTLLGDAAGARQERERAAQIPLQEALDYFLTGDTLQKHEKTLPQAANAFARALRAEPEHFWAQYFLGVCNLRLFRWGEARSNFTGCLRDREKSPSLYPSLYLFRAFANAQLNDFSAADGDYRTALTQDPDLQTRYGILVNQGVLCLRQVRPIDATAPLRWLLPVTSTVEGAWRGGVEQLRYERRDAAARFLEQARQLQPEHYPAYRSLAIVHQQKGQTDVAVEMLGKALEIAERLEPKERAWQVQGPLRGQRARLHRDRRELEQALRDLDHATLVYPKPEDLIESGRIRHVLKRYPAALADFDAALGLRPELVDAYRWKSTTLWAMQRGAEAATAVDQYLAKGGRRTADVYRTRAQVRAQDRQFLIALPDFTQALELRPDSATYAARGWVFLAADDRPNALKDFEAAIRLDNRNSEGYNGRGLIRVWLGQYGDALADVDAALRLGDVKAPALFWNAAHIYAQIAGGLAAEPGSQNPTASATRAGFERKAAEMVKKAVAVAPDRSAFWLENIAPDPLLNPIRGCTAFKLLEMEVKGK